MAEGVGGQHDHIGVSQPVKQLEHIMGAECPVKNDAFGLNPMGGEYGRHLLDGLGVDLAPIGYRVGDGPAVHCIDCIHVAYDIGVLPGFCVSLLSQAARCSIAVVVAAVNANPGFRHASPLAFVKPLRPEGRIVALADLVLEEVGKPGVTYTILGEEHPLRHPVRKEQGDIRSLEDGIHRIIHEDVAVQGSVDILENLVEAGLMADAEG